MNAFAFAFAIVLMAGTVVKIASTKLFKHMLPYILSLPSIFIEADFNSNWSARVFTNRQNSANAMSRYSVSKQERQLQIIKLIILVLT